MRNWVASLEEVVDRQLVKWIKGPRIENGEAVQMKWQFEQTHIIVDIFWEDYKETIHFQYLNPRSSHRHEWHGLNSNTFNRVMDRVGNLAQITMYPPIDSELDA